MAMMFVDRLLLARFSLEAHNIAVEAVNLGWAFQNGWISLAAISQIFVAQYVGANQTGSACLADALAFTLFLSPFRPSGFLAS